MTEDRLQFNIVTSFHHRYPLERGYLCRTENKTQTAARDKGLGMVKGMSDLKYTAIDSTQVFFEIKVNGTRHTVKHLQEQLNFIEKHNLRGCIGGFIFTKEQFEDIMNPLVEHGKNGYSTKRLLNSCEYIRSVIKESKTRTVTLNYKVCDIDQV